MAFNRDERMVNLIVKYTYLTQELIDVEGDKNNLKSKMNFLINDMIHETELVCDTVPSC
jgi:hypothetical protein